METFNIKIPYGLTKPEEASMIAGALTKKLLGTNKVKEIGTGYEITHSQTKIIITREYQEELTITAKCNRCDCEYDIRMAKRIYHNYGGKSRFLDVCSENCQNEVLDFLGDRASAKKSKLKPFKLFNYPTQNETI